MKEYFVYADVTMAVHECVSADSEEEAKRIALERIQKEPNYYARKADACVNIEITDVNEE